MKLKMLKEPPKDEGTGEQYIFWSLFLKEIFGNLNMHYYLLNPFLWMLVEWTTDMCLIHISNNIFG